MKPTGIVSSCRHARVSVFKVGHANAAQTRLVRRPQWHRFGRFLISIYVNINIYIYIIFFTTVHRRCRHRSFYTWIAHARDHRKRNALTSRQKTNADSYVLFLRKCVVYKRHTHYKMWQRRWRRDDYRCGKLNIIGRTTTPCSS